MTLHTYGHDGMLMLARSIVAENHWRRRRRNFRLLHFAAPELQNLDGIRMSPASTPYWEKTNFGRETWAACCNRRRSMEGFRSEYRRAKPRRKGAPAYLL